MNNIYMLLFLISGIIFLFISGFIAGYNYVETQVMRGHDNVIFNGCVKPPQKDRGLNDN